MPGPAPRPTPAHPIPRPEHPRPDFRRPEWLCLNGEWDFAFDPEDRGRAEGWQRPGASFGGRILVPFPWESLAAWGQAALASDARFFSDRAYREPVPQPEEPVLRGAWHDARRRARRHEIGWYRRTFRVPPDWLRADRRVFLVVGAADWQATVWCNGIPVGEHEGGYTPFSVELTGALRPAGDENVVVIRVYDPADHAELPGGKQHWWYERTSGIWQSVYLEARPEAYLTHLRVLPDVAGRRVRVEVGICPVAGEYEVRVTARSPQGELFTASGVCPGCERRTIDLPLGPHPALWSPDDPQLYELTVEVAAPAAGERTTDVVHSYFGLREVGVGHLPGTDVPCLTLNGHPLYLRAALHQAFHPAGVYAYVDDAIIRDDLQTAKAAGLNALRLHIKVDDPRLYYWADRLGLAILYDLPGPARQTPAARRNWEKVLREAIERDANHPSILAWILFNETWGLGDARTYREDSDTQAWVADMVALTKRLDPTRLVEDNSPCNYDHVVTDINSWHFYINDYERARAHIAEAVARTYPGSGWNFVPGRTQGGQPLMNSEYGGIAAGDGDRDVSFCLKWLTAELRRHEKICGYVYTELTDLEWEHNGLVRYDRLPKEFPYDLRDVFGADVLVVDGPPIVRLAAGGALTVHVLASIFSGLPDGRGALRWAVEGTDTCGRHVHGAHGEVPVVWRAMRVTDFGPLTVPLPAHPGVYQVRLALFDAAGRRVCGTYVDVLADAPGPALPELAAEGFASVHRQGDYWVGEGAGTVRVTLPVPDGDGARPAELVFEAAAGVPYPRQTDALATPSAVAVVAGGRRLGTFRLPDAPADARGVLSYAAGLPGPYGYLFRVPLTGVARGGRVQVELRAGPGGLSLFGPAAGRYPVGLAVL
jgi:hypothetical protein